MANQSPKLANLKVGLTIFIGLVLFFVFLFLIGSENNFFGSSYNLKIFVENSDGLTDGSLITLGGLKIGSVSGLTFARRDDTNGIDITLSINERYKKQITTSSIATVKTIGLLGDKFIDISIGQPDEKPLADNSYLPVETTFTLDKLSAKAEPAIENLTKLLSNLTKITDTISSGKGNVGKFIYGSEAINKLESILGNLNKLTTVLNSGKGSLGKLVYDSTLYNRIDSLTNNLNQISYNIKNGKGSLGKLVTQDSIYNYATTIAKKLDLLIAKTESDSSIAGALINNKKMYFELNTIISEVNELVQKINADPQKYLKITVF
jgi:phospholipid/cholesterol/gamma-HCH transport system substrate-binding protein